MDLMLFQFFIAYVLKCLELKMIISSFFDIPTIARVRRQGRLGARLVLPWLVTW
jgi:hypothetical protein